MVPSLATPTTLTQAEFRAMVAAEGATPESRDGVDIFTLHGVRVQAVLHSRAMRRELARAIDEFDPDWVLVSAEDPARNLLTPALAARPDRVLYLVLAPNALPFGPHALFPGETRTRLVSRVTGIVTLSESTRQYVARWGRLPAAVMRFPAFGGMPFPVLGNFDQGSVMMINPSAIKGISIFMALARELKDTPFTAVTSWATTAADEAALRAMPNVRIVGPSDDTNTLYGNARILLVPSLWQEDLASTVIEAMLRGIPVLASDVGGLPEAKLGTNFVLPVKAIQTYDEGVDDRLIPRPLVPDQDIGPWLDALRRLLTDRQLYAAESDAARRAASAFVADFNVQSWEGLLAGLATRIGAAGTTAAKAADDDNRKATETILAESPIEVLVAATFAAEPIGESLEFWLREMQVEHRVEFASHGQVFQALLASPTRARGGSPRVTAILVRVLDWVTAGPDRAARELIAALKAHAAQGDHYVVIISPSPDSEARRTIDAAEALLATELSSIPNIRLFTPAVLLEAYPVGRCHDERAAGVDELPYTRELYAALGTLIARAVYAVAYPPRKVIVLDADGTLWSGVCAEDGPMGVDIDPPHAALQRFMVDQHQAGMLLCLASKNTEQDVLRTFTQRVHDMPLRLEHFVAHRINWRPKSDNLRELAEELGLDLSSFIMVEDSPIECAEVRAHCPEVAVVELPVNPAEIPAVLAHTWALDRSMVTEEDRGRSAFYRANAEREQTRRESPTLEDFLEKLELQVDIAPMGLDCYARAAQLTRRTNQFNCRPIRRSEADLKAVVATHGLDGRVVRVRDRFGDYGLVGVMLFRLHADVLSVDTYLLSCRALGRRVEHRMLAHLGHVAADHGLAWIEVEFLATDRNRPASEFLNGIVEPVRDPKRNGPLYRIPLERALTAPDLTCRSGISDVPPNEPQAHRRPAMGVETSPLIARIATDLRSPGALLRAIDQRTAPPTRVIASGTGADSGLEARLTQIWEHILGRSVKATDNFFDLGGDSLSAMRIAWAVESAFGSKPPLMFVFDGADTVRAMARDLIQRNVQLAGPLTGALPTTAAVPTNSQLHVMIFTPDYPPDVRGGMGTLTRELATGLCQIGAIVDVIVAPPVEWKARPTMTHPAQSSSMRVHLAPVTSPSRNADVLTCAEEIIRAHGRPDVVHTNELFFYPACAELRRRLGTPAVASWQLPWQALSEWAGQPLTPGHAELERLVLRDADAIITPSWSMRSVAAEHYGVGVERVHVVHNGLDHEALFRDVPAHEDLQALRHELAPPDAKIVLYAGRLVHMKGIGALFEAAAQIVARRVDVHFIIAGEAGAEYEREYAAILERHAAILGHFSMLGRLARERLAAVYLVSDMAVLPHVYDPFPYAALEAMAAGLPVVATAAGGLAEIVVHNVTGLHVPVRQLDGPRRGAVIEDLAEAIEALLDQPGRARAFGAAGRARVLSRYRATDMVAGTLGVYRSILARSGVHTVSPVVEQT